MNDPTQNLSHEAVSRALEALFVDRNRDEAFREVPAWRVHRHMARCEMCRRQYDALALTDRRLCSQDSPPDDGGTGALAASGFERSFGEASFQDALGRMLAAEKGRRSQAAPDEPNATDAADDRSTPVVDLGGKRSAPQTWRGRFGVAAAVLLVGGASWFGFHHLYSPHGSSGVSAPDAQFQARSAATLDAHGPYEPPEVEIFCAERTGEDVQFTGTQDAPFGLLGCPSDGEIKLAYQNNSSQLQYAAFFGVDQQARIYWYGPTPADGDAVEVEQTDRLTPFGESIRLEVNHQPGPVRVVGLFSPRPIDFIALREAVDEFDRKRLFEGERPDSLPVPGVLTSSTFEVSDGGKR